MVHVDGITPRTGGSRERVIVVVEDDAPVRSLLTGHLGRPGQRVLEASDAETAVRHLVSEPVFDLVVTDIHLPGLSGLELLELLQSHSPMKPVLIITGDDQDELARRALAAGATGYLVKPFQIAELDANVAQAFQQLDLLERLGEGQPAGRAGGAFGVPVQWLEVADRRSGAGAGHGGRVEKLAMVLAKSMGVPVPGEPLRLAARVHELGGLTEADRREETIPELTADLLDRVGVAPDVRALVAGMAMWWGDAPALAAEVDASVGALMVADRIDHHATLRVAAGEFPPTAVMEAVEAVAREAGTRLSPDVEEATLGSREVVSAIWILGRGGYGRPPAHGPGRTQPPPSRGAP